MKCMTCVWGKTAYKSKSLYGPKTIIVCNRNLCTEHLSIEEDTTMSKKPLIYVCSPLKGNAEKNLARAARFCRFVSQQGGIPFAPHLFFTSFLNDEVDAERALGRELGLEILSRCSAMWVFGDIISEGMQAEIDLAEQLGISALYYDNACRPMDERT